MGRRRPTRKHHEAAPGHLGPAAPSKNYKSITRTCQASKAFTIALLQGGMPQLALISPASSLQLPSTERLHSAACSTNPVETVLNTCPTLSSQVLSWSIVIRAHLGRFRSRPPPPRRAPGSHPTAVHRSTRTVRSIRLRCICSTCAAPPSGWRGGASRPPCRSAFRRSSRGTPARRCSRTSSAPSPPISARSASRRSGRPSSNL